MTTVPTSETFVDQNLAERPIATVSPHPDVDRIRRFRVNRAGHVCRECRNPQCVGGLRERHEETFARAETSWLLPDVAYFACPGCGGNVRTAPPCRDLPAVP